MTACPKCGSTDANQDESGCLSTAACRYRQGERRVEEARWKPGYRQCLAELRGGGVTLYCGLNQGHDGDHLNGARTWCDLPVTEILDRRPLP